MLPNSVEDSMSLTQSYQILPKRTEQTPLRVNGLSEQMEFRTNCYDIQLTGKSLFMYQYVVETDPVIPLDSTKIWYKLVKDIEIRLQKMIGLVSHRGNTLWGNKCLEGESLDLIWTSRYRTRRDPKFMSESSFIPKSVTCSQFGNSMETSKVANSMNTSFISQSGSSSFSKQKPLDASMLGKSIEIPSQFKFTFQSAIKETKTQKSQGQSSKNQSVQNEKKSKVSKNKKTHPQKQSKEKGQKKESKQKKFQNTLDRSNKDFIENETKYRVSIRLTSKLDLKQLITDETQRGKIIQIINIKIKDKLESLGYLQLGKGKFYEKSRLGMDRLQEVGLQVLRGFRFSLIALAKDKLCFQIDPCTRIMQSQNLLEIIQAMGKYNVGRLKGAIVMSRYGNFKTYKIDSIDYKMSPNSYFFVNDNRKGKLSNQRAPKIKKTYLQYFKQAYGMTITNLKQPLVKIYEKPTKVIKRGAIKQKPKFLYLIPQLLSLTGMTQVQRKNNMAMKALAPYTKLAPKARFMETQKLIHQIQASDNTKAKNDFSMIAIKQPTMVKGFQLNPVHITMKSTEIISNGQFSLRKPLLNPAKLDDWLLFCSNATKHQKIKDFISCLDKASKQLGIILNNPFINVISYEEGDKDFRSQKEKWEEGLRKELGKENDLPQVVVVYLQPFEEKFYPEIKRLLINEFGVVSQAIKAQTFEKQLGTLSIATAVIVQINQKVGKTVWKVERNHQQFNENSYQIFSSIKEKKTEVDESAFSFVNQSRISNETKKSKKHKHEKKDHKEKKEKREKKEKKERKEEKHKKQKKEKKENEESKLEKKDQVQKQKPEKIQQKEIKSEYQDSSKLEIESFRIEQISTLSKEINQNSSAIGQSKTETEKVEKKHKKENKEKKHRDDKSQEGEKNEKKQKKQKKQKDDKSQKAEKKEKKDKNKKEYTVVSAPLVELSKPSLTYEEIKARQLQRQTNKAFKNAPIINLNLTSTLEIASAGFSSSTNLATGKFTLSFVGTTNKQQSQVYTHCRYGMRRKDFLPDLEYEVIFNHWLKTYYEKSKLTIDGKEHHSMPSILVVYREGLSDGQLRKQVLREVRILKKIIANKVPKSLKYDPEIIYLTVNKHPSTRYFSATSKNAAPGSVIFDHFSSAMNFHLISQHVAEGSSTPTQYRIAYRNRFSLSDGALAQFTYELCYGYYNWAGGVRVPAPLQCAGKLARLVGESVRQNVFKIDKQKVLISQSVTHAITKSNVFDQSLIEKLDTSSISSLGQSTVNNFLAIQTSSFDSSFNFFKNQNVFPEKSFTSFTGINTKGSESIKEKPEGKQKGTTKFKAGKYTQKDFQNKNLPFKKYDTQKSERVKGQRKKEIVDTFYFL